MSDKIHTANVMTNPDLLERYIRAQYLAALQGDEDISLHDRREARLLVARLASMRGDTFRETLALFID